MRIFDRRRRILRFSAAALIFMLFIGWTASAIIEKTSRERPTPQTINKDLKQQDLRQPPPEMPPPYKQPPIPNDSYTFSTPFIWTFEIFFAIYGATAGVYLYKRYKKNTYRTR